MELAGAGCVSGWAGRLIDGGELMSLDKTYLHVIYVY